MTELSVKIGGIKYNLRESPKEFSVLSPTPAKIHDLERIKSVEGISNLGQLSVVRTIDPKNRDDLMEDLRKTGVAHHVYEIEESGFKDKLVITDKINLKFKQNVSKEKREKFMKKYHLQFRRHLTSNLYSCQLTNETGMNPIKLCSVIDGAEELEYAEPDFVMKNKLFSSTIQDNLFREQWHLHDEIDIPFTRKGCDIKIKGAWLINKGDPNVIIAVMDDGFDLTNPDLEHKIKFPSDFTRTSVSGDPTAMLPDDVFPLAESEREGFPWNALCWSCTCF